MWQVRPRLKELMTSRRMLGVIIMALSILVYLNAIPNGFVWDDRYLLSENPYIRDIRNIPSFFTSSASQASYDMQIYRPLRQVLFAVEFQLFGGAPEGYHAINVVFHAVNCLLLFMLLEQLGLSRQSALLLAALFSVHPVNVESVANITGRTEVLFACFYLTGLIAFIRSLSGGRPARGLLTIAAVAYSLSLLSKEMAFSFPLIVLLTHLYVRNGNIRNLAERKYFYMVLGAISLCYLLVRNHALKGLGSADYYGDSFWSTFFTQTAIFFKYIKLFFIPYPLSARYDLFLIETPFNRYTVIFSAALLFLWYRTAVAVKRRQVTISLFGAWWFLITLLPVSNLIPIRAAMMGERYLYIPVIGLFLMVFGMLEQFPIRKPVVVRAILAVLAGVFLSFATLTVARTAVWKDNRTLFEDAEKKAPDSLAVHWNLFYEYQVIGDQKRAAAEYREMLRINEETARKTLSLAERYERQGRSSDAVRMARKALVTKPDLTAARELLDRMNVVQPLR